MKRSVWWLATAIILMLANNIIASSLLGLGDAEALYYCYGQNPSLSYLDHPPLVGWLIYLSTRLVGSSVLSVRAVSMVMSALTLLFVYLLTTDIYGRRAGAWSALLLVSTPVFSIGMVAATPDAPLAALWSLFTWQLHGALTDNRDRFWTRWGRPILLSGVLGLSFLAKYTGACLVVAILAAVLTQKREWLKRPVFWMGAAIALAITLPVWLWNAEHDFAGLWHRLVWTQKDAGFSFKNLGSLIGGQLLYVGPLTLALLAWSGVRIFKQRRERPERMSLIFTSIPALALTYLLVAWSNVAEPHWPAAGYLPLFAAAAGLITELEGRSRTLGRCAVALGLGALVLANILILTPLLPALSPKSTYRPEFDLGNELRGWTEVAELIRATDRDNAPVVAAFYTQCGQLAFALSRPGDPEVRCASANIDDFDFWQGRFELSQKGALFVTDNRFDHKPAVLFKNAAVKEPATVLEITRGGRWVRKFKIFRLAPNSGRPNTQAR